MTVPAVVAPPLGGTSKNAGALSGARAIRIGEDEATLVIQGVTQVVKIGDQIGTDLVKSISPGRMVLLRPASAGAAAGESIVIVQFDPQGRTQILVLASRDTTAKAPVAVK